MAAGDFKFREQAGFDVSTVSDYGRSTKKLYDFRLHFVDGIAHMGATAQERENDMARISRFGAGQTPTGNPFREGKLRRHLSAYDRQKCLRCGLARWYHSKSGLVPDHDFIGKTDDCSHPVS